MIYYAYIFTLLVGFVFGLTCLVQIVKAFRQYRLDRLWWLMPYTLCFVCMAGGSLLHIRASQTTQPNQLKAFNAADYADYAMFSFMALGAVGTLKQKASK